VHCSRLIAWSVGWVERAAGVIRSDVNLGVATAGVFGQIANIMSRRASFSFLPRMRAGQFCPRLSMSLDWWNNRIGLGASIILPVDNFLYPVLVDERVCLHPLERFVAFLRVRVVFGQDGLAEVWRARSARSESK
jgi:hypothetical protein